MEKVYKTMQSGGIINLAAGIVILTTGVATGVLLIVSGALLLKNKKNIIF